MVANLDKLAKQFRDNKLSHAFILQTNNKKECLKSVLSLLKQMACENEYTAECNKCSICHQIDNNEFLGIYVLYPDGKAIKKEQVLDLKRKMAFKPLFSKFLAYVIMDAEKLNASSTNTMLKFLEEPEDDVYGFLIVDSKENLLTTIQSRCQIETIMFEETTILNKLNLEPDDEKKYISSAQEYIDVLTMENEDLILYNKDVILNNFSTREEIEILFKIINEAYQEALEIKTGVKSSFSFGNFDVILKDSFKTILSKKKIITEFLNNINYNLNIELMLDRFVIEMSDVHE